MADGGPPPTKTLDQLEAEHRPPPARFFHRHGPEASEQNPLRNYVRDLILGFNDGLVSVYAIVAGVVGAGFAAPSIAVAGAAAAVAGALSMGIGEYLSTKSQAEYYAAERRLEQQHIRDYPELEQQEMRAYMAAKGLDGELLDRVMDRINADPERFLDVMMREEFGHGPQTDRSPWVASALIMAAFVVGAALPVMPFFVLDARPGIWAASALSLGALLLAGAVKAWVSGLSKVRSALEMAVLGVAAAAITYGVGALIGVAL